MPCGIQAGIPSNGDTEGHNQGQGRSKWLLANAVPGLAGFGAALLTLHLTGRGDARSP
jgi:hypothetical protein